MSIFRIFGLGTRFMVLDRNTDLKAGRWYPDSASARAASMEARR